MMDGLQDRICRMPCKYWRCCSYEFRFKIFWFQDKFYTIHNPYPVLEFHLLYVRIGSISYGICNKVADTLFCSFLSQIPWRTRHLLQPGFRQRYMHACSELGGFSLYFVNIPLTFVQLSLIT